MKRSEERRVGEDMRKALSLNSSFMENEYKLDVDK